MHSHKIKEKEENAKCYVTITALYQMSGGTSLYCMRCGMVTISADCKCYVAESPTSRGQGRKIPGLEDSQVSLSPGTTSKCLLSEHEALLGICQERQFWRYIGPRQFRALMVRARTLTLIWYFMEERGKPL